MNDRADTSVILPHLEQSDLPDIAIRLMSVALRLFAKKGYTATSVREIVRMADVTNPMLYYYFNSKEGLYRKLVEHLFETVQRQVGEAIEEAATFREKVFQIAWTQLQGAQESPVILQFVYGVLFGPQTGRPDVDIFEFHVEMYGYLTELFDSAIEDGEITPREGVDALFLTQQLMGMINNHLIRALTLTQSLDDPMLERRYLSEILSREECTRLTEFFFAGAGCSLSGDEAEEE